MEMLRPVPDRDEVAQEAVGDGVAAAAWWAHTAYKLRVHDGAEGAGWLALVPAPVVHPLPQKLDRALRKLLLELRRRGGARGVSVCVQGRGRGGGTEDRQGEGC